ncbi:MAG: hypothetical protein EXR98_08100 [Gemmataceae bacterium]|nr:hypothetical protein [Gemmataceae bacterium]
MRCKLTLAVLMVFGLFVGLGLTQPQPGKDPKDKDKKDPPTIEKLTEPDSFKDDLKTVREAGLKGDGPDLIEYFRQRTLKAPDPKAIAVLVKQLGDEDFDTREKAFTTLVGMGASAMAGIKQGENDPDLEVRKRLADLKQRIDTKAEPILQSAAARCIAKLKPQGAADGLMAFLPFSSDPMVVDEICKTLGAVAVVNGKIEPVILKSLDDQVAVKRGAAGEALARAGVKEELPNVKKLLKDTDVSVRYRICMAMLTHKDKDIVPVMIDLLADMTPNQLWPIEEALLRLAGDKAPIGSLGNDAAARKTYRDAWSKWYATNAANIDMARLSQENIYLGYTMIVQHNNRIGAGGGGNVGEIFELDKDKNLRWKISIPVGYPVDAQYVGGNRVVVAEYQGGRVTERDTIKGEIKWDYQCGGNPFSVQRLSNGNTFVAMQGRLIEVDRNKNEVWSYQRPNQDMQRARKLPNGEVAFITNVGQYIRMDPRNQKVSKQFNVIAPQIIFGSIDVLPNGHVLVAQFGQGRVTEYNQDGGQVGNPIVIAQPNSVVRLPNGNNLVTSYQQRQVYEFNGAQQVWNFQTDGIVFVARRR